MRFSTALTDVVHSRTTAKIVMFLLNHTAAMSGREIASVLKVSHMSVNRMLRKLEAVNLAGYTKVGKAHVWSINRRSYAYRVLSRQFAHKAGENSPLADLKATIAANTPWKLVRRVIIFGSLVRGEDTTESDIDVCFVVTDRAAREKLALALDKLSDLCLEKYGNRLAPYILTKVETKSRKRAALWREIQAGMEVRPLVKGGKS